MIALWDTTGTDVLKALSAERRNAGSAVSAVALTLVAVVADEGHVLAAEEACAVAAGVHPCRLVIVVRSPDVNSYGRHPSRLDAEVMVGGRLGAVEGVVLRMYGRLTKHAESVVIPLLASDVPVVTWWHEMPPDVIASDALGVLAQRRITDVAQAADPVAALRQRAEDFAPGDTDLAWGRSTPWRTALTTAYEGVSQAAASATVTAAPNDPGGVLLRGWLQSRLNVAPTAIAGSDGVEAVTVTLRDGQELALERVEGGARVRRPGMPDRTVSLQQAQLGDLLAQELRLLGPDLTYAAALGATTGHSDLMSRPSSRTFIWVDTPVPGQRQRPEPTVLVSEDAGVLAHDVAARLLAALRNAQAARGYASIVLTGGRIAEQIYASVRDSSERDTVDWGQVDIWWGDERFLPAGDPERNDTQVKAVLLDTLSLDRARVHPMPASDGPDGANIDAAATSYAKALAAAATSEPGAAQVPIFDVLLLSVGEDGHIASVFPNHQSATELRTVAAVRDSPKPPPNRITLTLPTLNTAKEVWIIASGAEKAEPVDVALTGTSPTPSPAASVHGLERTVWLLDEAAARDVPAALHRPHQPFDPVG